VASLNMVLFMSGLLFKKLVWASHVAALLPDAQ